MKTKSPSKKTNNPGNPAIPSTTVTGLILDQNFDVEKEMLENLLKKIFKITLIILVGIVKILVWITIL